MGKDYILSEECKSIADDTLKLLEQGYYINRNNEKIEIAELLQYSVQNTELYTPGQLETLQSPLNATLAVATKFEVVNETTFDAARRLAKEGDENILCLNFASAINPGGGFLKGTIAQEECLARASGLYPCLLKTPDYYSYHRSRINYLYSDHMIWSPEVPVFKDENGNTTDSVLCVSIITSAAVNARQVQQNDPESINMIEQVMQTRIDKLLALCATKKHPVLILGAWGCGVFGNNPDMIAGLFHEALTGKFSGCFKRIVFAVKTNDESMIESFRKRFKSN